MNENPNISPDGHDGTDGPGARDPREGHGRWDAASESTPPTSGTGTGSEQSRDAGAWGTAPRPGAGESDPDQPGYGAAQPGYGAAQPGYGAAQPAYGTDQPGYGAGQPAYGTDQSAYGAGRPGYRAGGDPLNPYAAAQAGYGAGQPGYGTGQPGYGAAQPDAGDTAAHRYPYASADSAPAGVAAGVAADGATTAPGEPGQPGEPGAGGPVPVAAGRGQRRFSTPVVGGLLVAVAVAASALTAVVVDHSDSGDSGVISSFRDTTANTKQTSTRTSEPGSTEDVASRVLPSVVSIQVQTPTGGGEGSGSVFTSDGLIVTNNHVVAGAEKGQAKIQVTLNDGRVLQANVVATDPQTDIAVVKAEGAKDLQPISVGNSDDLKVGQDVVAVGSPLGLSSTVTSGIVSAMNRPVQATGEGGGEASLIDAIQTDAAINPGNSGGALVNMNGELIGIPSVIASLGAESGQQSGSIGLGFAIPANQAVRIARQLIDDGRAQHAIIGAQVNTRSQVNGAEIVSVQPGSPADSAGLKAGDVVHKVDDRLVDNGVGLIAAIRSHTVGDKVTLTVTDGQGGNEHRVSMTLTAEGETAS
ncbi:trypsin-like peptidase domain-containing protein [Corynebacterium bovis]|uniref:trypsin-like peptidase domain-containing protein n=1 Tax=Corynebacterium bovis TaxID=36808 RepID=UPI00313A3522